MERACSTNPGRCPGLTSLAPSGRKTADFAPIAALLLFVAIIAAAAGGLHLVQTLREQARRAQCAGGLKPLRISLTSRVPQVVLIDGNSGSMAMDDPYDDLTAPPLIESCLAELEADDA
jgi:hypothetical protein